MDYRAQLRQELRLKRNSLSSTEQKQAAIVLKEKLSKHPKVRSAKHIAVYLANDGELDPKPFIQWCWQNNICVYLPVIHPFSPGNLLFLHYQENTVLIKNEYGVAEPKLNVTTICPARNLDLIFTPLVAFDKHGNRLGMGGGFYDRTLSHCQKEFGEKGVAPEKKAKIAPKKTMSAPYPIGLAHNCQLIPLIPIEHWDIPLPEIITPTFCYKKDQ